MRKTCRNCKHSNYTPENFVEVTKACEFCGIYLANWEPKEDVPDINDGNMEELIRKQAMLHAIEKCHKKCCRTDSNGDEWIHYETALNELEALPPVQTEPLTDYEQRIFLAAMGKERAVCKKLADEWDSMKLDVPCPVNLLRLCAEVERKVKAALWTN